MSKTITENIDMASKAIIMYANVGNQWPNTVGQAKLYKLLIHHINILKQMNTKPNVQWLFKFTDTIADSRHPECNDNLHFSHKMVKIVNDIRNHYGLQLL